MEVIKIISKSNIKLQRFLEDNNISKRATNKLIKNGIKVNNFSVYKNIEIKKGDIVEIPIEDENVDYEAVEGKLDILYEDSQIIIINKPSGLTMNSKNQINLSNFIAYYFIKNNINRKVRLINRLDMNTSGIMLIAKNKYAQAYYQKQIENNLLTKKYIAIVEGSINIKKKIKINIEYNKENKNYINSKKGVEAITIFKTIENHNEYTILEAEILTGKTHQIRSSLKYLNHPIIGDYLYGSKYKLNRFLLHSYHLEFNEFYTSKRIQIESMPRFQQYISELGF